MIARLHSAALSGIDAIATEVEVDIADRGFASVSIVGLPDAACKESLERVRSAIQNSGYTFPRYKTVISLAPADVRNEGVSGTDAPQRASPRPADVRKEGPEVRG